MITQNWYIEERTSGSSGCWSDWSHATGTTEYNSKEMAESIAKSLEKRWQAKWEADFKVWGNPENPSAFHRYNESFETRATTGCPPKSNIWANDPNWKNQNPRKRRK